MIVLEKCDSLSQSMEYIQSIDFSKIINKMVSLDGWVKKDAILTSHMYKNFLFLKKKYGNNYSLPPSEEIDLFWHYHILDTKKYEIDCSIIFGGLLHHYPYFGLDENTNTSDLNKDFEQTKELYFREFNEHIILTRLKYNGFVNFLRKKIDSFSEKKKYSIVVSSAG